MHAYAAATQAAGRSQRWQLQCRVSAPGLLQRHQGHYATTAMKKKKIEKKVYAFQRSEREPPKAAAQSDNC